MYTWAVYMGSIHVYMYTRIKYNQNPIACIHGHVYMGSIHVCKSAGVQASTCACVHICRWACAQVCTCVRMCAPGARAPVPGARHRADRRRRTDNPAHYKGPPKIQSIQLATAHGRDNTLPQRPWASQSIAHPDATTTVTTRGQKISRRHGHEARRSGGQEVSTTKIED